MWIYLIIAFITIYLLFTIYLTYLVHQIPRNPVKDRPDWGRVKDTRIPAVDGGSLEVWRIEPDRPSRGIVLLVHGWSRNRDRMVFRARIFGKMGFTTVIHSARDHGKSTPYRFMNAFRFAEDAETVLKWINEPVILYGHSAGAAGAIIIAHRNPDLIKLLFLEGCYARTKKALRSLYRSYNIVFGIFLGPFVVFWMDVFYKFRMEKISPARLASDIHMPVMLIHGEKDESFPLKYAYRLRDSFQKSMAELYIGKGADHSGSSLTPEYPNAIRSFVDRHL